MTLSAGVVAVLLGVFVAITGMVAAPGQVAAQMESSEAQAVMALTCDAERNRALLRFTDWPPNQEPYYFPPLPPEIDGGLSALPVQASNVCRFADGRELKVKHGAGGYDKCETSKGDWFSLWLDRRKVFSREGFFSCWSGLGLHSVIIDGRRIAVCEYPDVALEIPAWSLNRLELLNRPVTCHDIDPALLPDAADTEEYPPPGVSRPRVGSIEIRFAQDAALCSSLVVPDRQSEDPEIYHLADPALYPEEIIAQQEWLSFRNVDAERIRFDDAISDGNTQSMLRTFMDFDNDDKDDSVVNIYGSLHYFYGNLFITIDIHKYKAAI